MKEEEEEVDARDGACNMATDIADGSPLLLDEVMKVRLMVRDVGDERFLGSLSALSGAVPGGFTQTKSGRGVGDTIELRGCRVLGGATAMQSMEFFVDVC